MPRSSGLPFNGIECSFPRSLENDFTKPSFPVFILITMHSVFIHKYWSKDRMIYLFPLQGDLALSDRVLLVIVLNRFEVYIYIIFDSIFSLFSFSTLYNSSFATTHHKKQL